MEAKAAGGDDESVLEIESLIQSQIKQSPRVASLYVDLVQYYKVSLKLESKVDSTVAELEATQVGKCVLLNSIEWLQLTTTHAKSATHRLNKQMFLVNLKLQKNDLTQKVIFFSHFPYFTHFF